ncbi:hypothetical protein [Winogradskya humida]|uniref:Uncharacterized protein n=1 Tax=Winogradskya humida TaxID=113566 RepID=A0ABQ3ZEM1_9ACTN|nr:hypothetical protein [Actinoplanes humidus]GIE17006.1 hypothetical protein Ahu01nite_001080 [Actinoplanes humidus]
MLDDLISPVLGIVVAAVALVGCMAAMFVSERRGDARWSRATTLGAYVLVSVSIALMVMRFAVVAA